jgi:hypothetical protein
MQTKLEHFQTQRAKCVSESALVARSSGSTSDSSRLSPKICEPKIFAYLRTSDLYRREIFATYSVTNGRIISSRDYGVRFPEWEYEGRKYGSDFVYEFYRGKGLIFIDEE